MVVIIASNGDRDTDRDGDLPKSINSKGCDKAASVSEDPPSKGSGDQYIQSQWASPQSGEQGPQGTAMCL